LKFLFILENIFFTAQQIFKQWALGILTGCFTDLDLDSKMIFESSHFEAASEIAKIG
jgi:hypothetical protein